MAFVGNVVTPGDLVDIDLECRTNFIKNATQGNTELCECTCVQSLPKLVGLFNIATTR